METPNSAATAVTIGQRLRLVTLALMAAQLLSLVVGWVVTQGHPAGSQMAGNHNPLIIPIGFAIGITLIAVSGLVGRRPATRPAQCGSLFFIGFVFAEIGVMIGLLLCFLLGKIAPLLLLAPASAAVIYANYLAITRCLIETHDRNSPP